MDMGSLPLDPGRVHFPGVPLVGEGLEEVPGGWLVWVLLGESFSSASAKGHVF